MEISQMGKKDTLELGIAEIAYYLYFSVMLFAKGMGLYQGMWPYTVSLVLGGFCVILKLALTEHTLAEWLTVLGLLGLGGLVLYNSGEIGALIYITMIVTMKGVPVKRIFAIGAVIWGGTFALQAVLTMTGIRSDVFMIHAKLGLGYIIRWSFGQPHPNVLQISFIILCGFILYLADWKGKKLVYATLIMLAGNLYVFFYSVSYTGLIAAVVYLFGNLYLSFRKELSKPEKLLAELIFPACVAFSVLGPVVFQGRLWSFFYNITNTRFYISRQYLTLEPISLFGARPSDAIPVGDRNIDCSYVFALMHYGAVIFILLCAGYMALIHHCLNKKKYNEAAIIFGLSVAAVTEPFFVNPSFKNISLLFLGEFLFESLHRFAGKYPAHFLNRTLLLCSVGKREFAVPVGKVRKLWDDYLQVWKNRKGRILIWTAGIAAAAGLLFAVMADMPECYYAAARSTHIDDGYQEIYLDIDNLPEDFEGKILNYEGPQTPMYRVEGNIVTMEYLRGIVSSGLWCGIFGGALVSVFLLIMRRKGQVTNI